MIDYDLYTPSTFSEAAFEDLMKAIDGSNRFPKYEPQKTWLTTSNVWNAILRERITNGNQFIIAPQYILPVGADAVMMDENVRVKNRAERRKQQREERRKSEE